MTFMRDRAKKLVSLYLWAAPCLFVQLAHVDHNYPQVYYTL